MRVSNLWRKESSSRLARNVRVIPFPSKKRGKIQRPLSNWIFKVQRSIAGSWPSFAIIKPRQACRGRSEMREHFIKFLQRRLLFFCLAELARSSRSSNATGPIAQTCAASLDRIARDTKPEWSSVRPRSRNSRSMTNDLTWPWHFANPSGAADPPLLSRSPRLARPFVLFAPFCARRGSVLRTRVPLLGRENHSGIADGKHF